MITLVIRMISGWNDTGIDKSKQVLNTAEGGWEKMSNKSVRLFEFFLHGLAEKTNFFFFGLVMKYN